MVYFEEGTWYLIGDIQLHKQAILRYNVTGFNWPNDEGTYLLLKFFFQILHSPTYPILCRDDAICLFH